MRYICKEFFRFSIQSPKLLNETILTYPTIHNNLFLCGGFSSVLWNACSKWLDVIQYTCSSHLQEVLDAQIAAEREQYQPSAMEKFMSIVKSMMMRGLVIYFFMSMFRRQPPPSGQAGAGLATNAFLVCVGTHCKYTCNTEPRKRKKMVIAKVSGILVSGYS